MDRQQVTEKRGLVELLFSVSKNVCLTPDNGISVARAEMVEILPEAKLQPLDRPLSFYPSSTPLTRPSKLPYIARHERSPAGSEVDGTAAANPWGEGREGGDSIRKSPITVP
jgi:hypothetical protein